MGAPKIRQRVHSELEMGKVENVCVCVCRAAGGVLPDEGGCMARAGMTQSERDRGSPQIAGTLARWYRVGANGQTFCHGACLGIGWWLTGQCGYAIPPRLNSLRRLMPRRY